MKTSTWDAYPHRRKGPWPQPAPRFPGHMAPAVLHVPLPEQIDWHRHVGSRYWRDYLTYWPTALAWAARQDGYAPISDAEFAGLFRHTVFARGLCASLDPSDRLVFGEVLAASEGSPDAFFKADYSIMRGVEPFDGLYTAATVTLFARYGAELRPMAIRVDDQTFTPADGDRWELAKYFALQGAAYHILLSEHPLVHFPTDTINAVSKTVLPVRHPLGLLLAPHSRFALRVNWAVLYSRRSIVENDQRIGYCVLTGPTAGIRTLNPSRYAGLPGSSAYRPYSYPLEPRTVHGDLGPFLNAYYATIRAFVTRIVEKIPLHDPDVVAWADAISSYLPGFPDGDEIFVDQRLAATVASYVHQVTVEHAADHESFGRLPLHQVPLRIRVPPPHRDRPMKLDRSKLATRADLFRTEMARHMFFEPRNVTLLHEVDYGFDDPALVAAQSAFHASLQQTHERLEVKPLIDWNRISASIQY